MKKLRAMWEKTGNFLNEVRVEMKKVSWPTRDEIISYTIVVLFSVLVLTIIIGIEDKILGEVVKRILLSR
jgi:preprotein translocase subunit SecE